MMKDQPVMVIGRPEEDNKKVKSFGPGGNENSLYKQTLELMGELRSIPDLGKWLFPYGTDNLEKDQTFLDPVATLWACFRLGKPFCILYNALKPDNPLPLRPISIPPNATSYPNSCKKAVYDFIVACRDELGMKDSELFTISGLYRDDTNEFVKLLNTLKIIINKMRDAGLLPEVKPLNIFERQDEGAPKDNLQKLITEILSTERSYISDLEFLQQYKMRLQNSGAVPKSIIVSIFSNLDNLLDFQRRFLLQMEAAMATSSSQPKLGTLLMQNEAQFSVYVVFCGNYQNASKQIEKSSFSLFPINPNIDTLRGLQSYLIKPIQRLCKYPLFVQQLIKYVDKDSPVVEDLKLGLESIRKVITIVNEEKRKEENFLIKLNTIERMDDWKDLDVREFGDLLLSDAFMTTSGGVERTWLFFLFESILLCVKDTGKRRKSKRTKKEAQSPTNDSSVQGGNTAYVLKGQILVNKMIYVTDTTEKGSSNSLLRIFWTEGQVTNYVILKCKNPEQSKQWKTRVAMLIEKTRPKSASVEANYRSGRTSRGVRNSDRKLSQLPHPNEVSPSSGVNHNNHLGNKDSQEYAYPVMISSATETDVSREYKNKNSMHHDDSYYGDYSSVFGDAPMKGNTSRDNTSEANRNSDISMAYRNIRSNSISGSNIFSKEASSAIHIDSNRDDVSRDNRSMPSQTDSMDQSSVEMQYDRARSSDKSPLERLIHYRSKSVAASSDFSDRKYLEDEGGTSGTYSKSNEMLNNSGVSGPMQGDRGQNASRVPGHLISSSSPNNKGKFAVNAQGNASARNYSRSSNHLNRNEEGHNVEDDLLSSYYDNRSRDYDSIHVIQNHAADSQDLSRSVLYNSHDKPLTLNRETGEKYYKSNSIGSSGPSGGVETCGSSERLCKTWVNGPKMRSQRVQDKDTNLADISNELDGIALSFAHVAEDDSSCAKDPQSGPNPHSVPKKTEPEKPQPQTGTGKQDVNYLRINYNSSSYVIALKNPVTFESLTQAVRNKIRVRGVGEQSGSTRDVNLEEILNSLVISYVQDDGRLLRVQTDEDARAVVEKSRKYYSEGAFVCSKAN